MEDEIVKLFNEGKWREIVDSQLENPHLPWIRPDKYDLEFIGDAVVEGNGKMLISIGCGSGFLEWLLSQSTGIKVMGLELDRSWWTSKYSKVFIPLTFVDDSEEFHFLASSDDAVLLFCYFNNEKAFIRYMEAFKGNRFIVIGPGPGRMTYTVPEPFNLPSSVCHKWVLDSHKEMENTKDYIAVYTRA